MGALEDAVCVAKGRLHELADELSAANAEKVILDLVSTVQNLHSAAKPAESPAPSPPASGDEPDGIAPST